MKLFFQLNEQEQNDALHYCTHITLHDIVEEGPGFDPLTSEDKKLKRKIDKALKQAAKFESFQEKCDVLMKDDDICRAIYEISLEMAKSAYYHGEDDFVIFTDELAENCNHDDEEDDEVEHDEDCEHHPKNQDKTNSEHIVLNTKKSNKDMIN